MSNTDFVFDCAALSTMSADAVCAAFGVISGEAALADPFGDDEEDLFDDETTTVDTVSYRVRR